VGDWVLALGGPFGLEGTVTAGIISAKRRAVGITRRDDFLQTDAAINPGNSGGPLVNLDGEVVGINTAISTRSGGNMGVGFSVPINMAKWVADQLVKTGVVKRAYLGVGIEPVTQDLAKEFGVKVREGVVVREVFDDTPAAKAGLKPGDVIVRFAGKPVSSPQELTTLVEQTKIGQKEKTEVVRDGKRIDLELTVLEQPKDFGLAARGGRSRGGPTEGSRLDQLGIEAAPLTKDVADQLGIKSGEGVVVTQVEPGSPAAKGGLTIGTVILQANRKPIRSVEDLKKAIEAQPLDKGVLLLIRTREGSRFVVIRVEK
jgi:serine protease Do